MIPPLHDRRVSIILGAALVPAMAFEAYYVLIATDAWIVARVCALFVIISCTFTLTVRWSAWYHQKMMADILAPMPKNATFSTDDDGVVTALVERMSGDPVVLTIPPDVADEGPQAAMAWIIWTLAR